MSELSKFRPLKDGVLVQRLEGNNVTNGGIIIPDTAQEKPQSGVVISVGNGLKDKNGKIITNDVNVGDRVIFTKWGGTEITLDGQNYLLMKQSDILGIDLSTSNIQGCPSSCCSCKGCN